MCDCGKEKNHPSGNPASDASCMSGRPASDKGCQSVPLKVVNIGLQRFYDAMEVQHVPVIQICWNPPVKKTKEVEEFLDMFL